MINNERIGVGVVTCGREGLFLKLRNSLLRCKDVDSFCSFEDTLTDKELESPFYTNNVWDDVEGYGMGSFQNVGVAKAKNYCLELLMNSGCDHIFLIEDDMYIRNPSVFAKYIEASKASGIQHFNFSQHGRMNKVNGFGDPNPRMIVNYGESSVALYPHCVGAFSYYSRKCLETVGLMDESYYNACEHVDHTYEIIKAGMHPPFWYFADIDKSWEYIGDEEWSIEKSTISCNPEHKKMMDEADKIFVSKHGHLPVQTPFENEEVVLKSLKDIKNQWT